MKYSVRDDKNIIVYYANGKIEKAIFTLPQYNPETYRNDPVDATFVFRNGEALTHKMMCDLDVNNRRPSVSEDGSKLFLKGWEHGMFAYSVKSGNLLWKNKIRRQNGNIIAKDDIVLGISCENKLVQVSAVTGDVLKQMQTCPRKILLLDITPDYCIVQTSQKSYSIIHKKTFETVQMFDSELLPERLIYDSFVTDGKLMVVTAFGDMMESSATQVPLCSEVLQNVDVELAKNRIELIERVFGLKVCISETFLAKEKSVVI